MKLGIDTSRYKHDTATGVEWYSKHIINAMLPLLSNNPTIEEALFYSPASFELPENSSKFTKRIIPFPRMWTLARLSYEMLTKTPDVLFVPSHTIPIIYPRKSVVTIHDVAFRRFKIAYSLNQYRHLNWSTKFAVKNAYKIIVPSEATKRDLMHFFKCEESKINVVHHGPPDFLTDEYQDKHNFENLLPKFGLDAGSPYMLFVGRLESKKNLVYLVESFANFSKEFPDWKLVLAGKEGIGFREIQKAIDDLSLGGKVILTGYVTEEEKNALYKGAQFVVFPSLYEGFGFPILEAFQHGKALLTSKGSACQEVAGEAAIIVDSHDKNEICEGMKKLVMNEQLRDDLAEKGYERLAEFSWQKAAAETLDVLLS